MIGNLCVTVGSVEKLNSDFQHIIDKVASRIESVCSVICSQSLTKVTTSDYQNWQQAVLALINSPLCGNLMSLQEDRINCYFNIVLANAKESVVPSLVRHESNIINEEHHREMLDTLEKRLKALEEIISSWKFYQRLKDTVSASLIALDSQLNLTNKTVQGHVDFIDRVVKLKPTFELHQKASSLMRQVCQELLVYCDEASREKLVKSVQNSTEQWQSVLSKLVTNNDASVEIIDNIKCYNNSVLSATKDLLTIRQVRQSSLPVHHDHLQERQSQADVMLWRLEKLQAKLPSIKYDLTRVIHHVESTTGLAGICDITHAVCDDSMTQLQSHKLVLADRLSVWSLYITRSSAVLEEIQGMENRYMNADHLTIEDLLDHMTEIYSPQLRRITGQVGGVTDHLRGLMFIPQQYK